MYSMAIDKRTAELVSFSDVLFVYRIDRKIDFNRNNNRSERREKTKFWVSALRHTQIYIIARASHSR